jgi:hypothetical protein
LWCLPIRARYICPVILLSREDVAAFKRRGGFMYPLRANRQNRVIRFAYDAQNRLRFTVDALGSPATV